MFITFEGGEGSGKSTQAKLLADRLGAEGHKVLMTQEPRGSEFGLAIWELLARGVDPMSELLLFAANRAHHVRTLIKPALERGEIVVCDRYSDSTIAYQQYGRGLDSDLVRRTCHYTEGGISPDVTFLLDLDPELGLKRKGKAVADDAIGGEVLAFHRRVREGYLSLAGEFPQRIRVLEATIGKQQLAEAISEVVSALASSTPGQGAAMAPPR